MQEAGWGQLRSNEAYCVERGLNQTCYCVEPHNVCCFVRKSKINLCECFKFVLRFKYLHVLCFNRCANNNLTYLAGKIYWLFVRYGYLTSWGRCSVRLWHTIDLVKRIKCNQLFKAYLSFVWEAPWVAQLLNKSTVCGQHQRECQREGKEKVVCRLGS